MTKLLLVVLFVPIFSFSQEKTDASKINFGLYVLPEMNGLKTSNLEGTETVHSKLGISAGLNFEYHLTEKAALRTGLGYGLKTYEHLHEGLIFNSDLTPQNGVQTESRMESDITYSEVQLPLLFQYQLTPTVFFTLGLEVNGAFADKSERTIYYGNGDVEKLANKTGVAMNYSPTLSVGYRVPNSGILIEPMFKYDLKKYIVIESNHYNYGLKVTYNLNSGK